MYTYTDNNNIQCTLINGASYPVIPLSRGLFAIVDYDNFEKLSKFNYYSRSTDTYACRNETIKGNIYKSPNGKWSKSSQKSVFMHHDIFPDRESGMVIDHINGNRLDNRKCNLRIVPYHKNSSNRTKKNINNSSGYQNVIFNKARNKFACRITIKGEHIFGGLFLTAEEANEKVLEIKREHGII